MTLDVQGLRDDVHRLVEQAAKIQRTIDEVANGEAAPAADEADSTLSRRLNLPPEIVVSDPSAVASYLADHPDLIDIIGEFASALVEEFRGERSEIRLDVKVDDYSDERDIGFNVRVSSYDESFIDRLDRLSELFDDRFIGRSGWVFSTTDFMSI